MILLSWPTTKRSTVRSSRQVAQEELKVVDTQLTSEVNVKVLTEEEALQLQRKQIRSDRLPDPPKNVFFGMLEVLEKPEPIKRRQRKKR